MSPARRRRSARTRSNLRPALLALALLAVAGVAGLLWLRGEAGQSWLAERGVEAARARTAVRYASALEEGLAAAGVSADSVLVRAAPPHRPATWEVETAGDLLALNAEVTARIEAAGGRVHRGRRWERDGSAVLELSLGGRDWVSHRVVVRRGPEAAALEPPPPPAGRLAIVVDDFGHNLGPAARRILALPAPVTLAILPERPASLRILNEARRAGKEALLHMPMEPGPEASPGPGPLALLRGMAPEEVRARLERCLDGLPGVVGVNNHMGSVYTQDAQALAPVMEVLDERGLLFLDSLTSPRSVAYQAARGRGLPAGRNDLFLDLDTEEPARIEARLRSLVERARTKGSAVGIGHVTPATAEALERVLPGLDPADVKAVFLSDLLTDRLPG